MAEDPAALPGHCALIPVVAGATIGFSVKLCFGCSHRLAVAGPAHAFQQLEHWIAPFSDWRKGKRRTIPPVEILFSHRIVQRFLDIPGLGFFRAAHRVNRIAMLCCLMGVQIGFSKGLQTAE